MTSGPTGRTIRMTRLPNSAPPQPCSDSLGDLAPTTSSPRGKARRSASAISPFHSPSSSQYALGRVTPVNRSSTRSNSKEQTDTMLVILQDATGPVKTGWRAQRKGGRSWSAPLSEFPCQDDRDWSRSLTCLIIAWIRSGLDSICSEGEGLV